MFDTIHCSYDLGPGFHNKTLQTKDISSTMSEFWLSPSGELYLIDYTGTQDFVMGDKPPFFKPNGRRGKVVATQFHGTIEVYPEVWTAYYSPYPRLMVTFNDGKIQNPKEFRTKSQDSIIIEEGTEKDWEEFFNSESEGKDFFTDEEIYQICYDDHYDQYIEETAKETFGQAYHSPEAQGSWD